MPITSPRIAALVADQPVPEMMAIGDSLFNGVRSLTMTRRLAELSVPAMVAGGLGLAGAFRTPDYPEDRPILFDLEEVLRRRLDFGDLRAAIIANAEAWLADMPRWSEHMFFDNIAIAGADVSNLQQDHAASFREQIPNLLNKVKSQSSIPFDTVFDLFYAINAAFLLNPSRDPDLDHATPVELVALRKPRRLLVSIGSNEGLFSGGFLCSYTGGIEAQIKRIPELMSTLAVEMRQRFVPGTVPHIYFMKLIRPRTLANLMTEDLDTPPSETYSEKFARGQILCTEYLPNYHGQFLGGLLSGGRSLDPTTMKRFDDAILEANNQVEEKVTAIFAESRHHVHFVDTYTLSTKHDCKHGCEHDGHATRIVVDGRGTERRLTNLPLATTFGGFRQGGLFGLDNMHPSTVGYAIFANAVLSAIHQAEGGPTPVPVSLDQAFRNDTLLNNLPNLTMTNLFLSIVGTIGSMGFFRLGGMGSA